MYHDVPDDATSAPYFAVPVDRFAAQLDRLLLLGKPGAALERWLDPVPPRAATALTFDDGECSNYANAYPALRERGMTATFFVITCRVGTEGYVTWPQLAEMVAHGMSIQSHTATHPLLSELSDAEVAHELRISREHLDDALRQHTRTLALPGGNPPHGSARHCDRLYRDAGYACIATTVWGPNDHPERDTAPDLLYVRRYTVRRDTSQRRFEACARTRSGARSPEALRLAVLAGLRRAVGASRYAGWRRRVLAVIGK